MILNRQMESLLFNKFQHGMLGKLIHTMLPYLTLFTCSLTEEEIKNNT